MALTIAVLLAAYVFRRPLARVLSVAAGSLLAVAVGISRLVFGVHWPTDVVAGLALGGAVASGILIASLLVSPHVPSGPEFWNGVVVRRWEKRRQRRSDQALRQARSLHTA